MSRRRRAASSAGERLLHTQEVAGSIPAPPSRAVAPSSSGPGRSPLKAEIAGSNPAGATTERSQQRADLVGKIGSQVRPSDDGPGADPEVVQARRDERRDPPLGL